MRRNVKELAKQAKLSGICSEWYEELKEIRNVEELATMYIRGIDFCLSNDFPSNEYLKRFKGKFEPFGIHLDEDFANINGRKIVILGKSSAKVDITEFSVSEVFVKNASRLDVSASGHSFVMIDAFDNSEVFVSSFDEAKIVVNKYGNAKVTIVENAKQSMIRIINKGKKTY